MPVSFVGVDAIPYAQRLVIGLYGRPGIGKSEMLYRLAKDYKQLVLIISMDRGTIRLTQHPGNYKRVMVVTPRNFQEVREAIVAAQDKVHELIHGKGVPAGRIWVCVDTMTHLQIRALAEARRMEITRQGTKVRDIDDYLRDATTQVDYNVNIGQMSEVSDGLVSIESNIVYIALEKFSERLGQQIPALSGQAGERLKGDCDVLAYMHLIGGGERMFGTQPHPRYEAKDRTGRLDAVEPPDLFMLYRKAMAQGDEESTSETQAPATTATEEPHAQG